MIPRQMYIAPSIQAAKWPERRVGALTTDKGFHVSAVGS
jgi:hypothetical protein